MARLIIGEDHTKFGAGGKPIDPVLEKHCFHIRLPDATLARGKGGKVRIFEKRANALKVAKPLNGVVVAWGERAEFPDGVKKRKFTAAQLARLAPADANEASRLRAENEALKAQVAQLAETVAQIGDSAPADDDPVDEPEEVNPLDIPQEPLLTADEIAAKKKADAAAKRKATIAAKGGK